MNKKDLWNEFCIWITPDGENRNNDLELLKEDLRAAKSLERDGLIDILGDSGMLPDGFLARLTDDGIVKAIKDYKGTSPIRQNIKDVAKINQFIRDRNEFSNKTFGSPLVRDCSYPLVHLKDEIQELLDAPDDKMEWADCTLLLLDAAWRKGYSLEDLIEFSIKKLEINKKRKWKKNDKGYFKHI